MSELLPVFQQLRSLLTTLAAHLEVVHGEPHYYYCRVRLLTW